MANKAIFQFKSITESSSSRSVLSFTWQTTCKNPLINNLIAYWRLVECDAYESKTAILVTVRIRDYLGNKPVTKF